MTGCSVGKGLLRCSVASQVPVMAGAGEIAGDFILRMQKCLLVSFTGLLSFCFLLLSGILTYLTV